jgi:hypothetical protein
MTKDNDWRAKTSKLPAVFCCCFENYILFALLSHDGSVGKKKTLCEIAEQNKYQIFKFELLQCYNSDGAVKNYKKPVRIPSHCLHNRWKIKQNGENEIKKIYKYVYIY